MVLHFIDLGDNLSDIFHTMVLLGDIVEGTEVREVITKSIGKSVSTKKDFFLKGGNCFSSCKIDFSLLKIVTIIKCDHEVVLGFGRVIHEERFLLFLVTNCQKVVKVK